MELQQMKIIYIKCEQNPQVNHTRILLKDVCEVWCRDTQLKKVCEAIVLYVEQEGIPNRHICSALQLIQTIEKTIQNVEVVVLGEEDMVVAYAPKRPQNKWWQWSKVIVVFVIIFFGSAFAIMTFNQDVDVAGVFGELAWVATGEQNHSTTMLEIGYSVGLAVGILLFYNHFSPKKMLGDPTPLEVEMREYEKEICTTMIVDEARRKKAEQRKS